MPEIYWQGLDLVRCPACECEFDQIRFRALSARPVVAVANATVDGESSCFFHAQNRAEAACESCGRYVCSVCRVDFAGRSLCPACLGNHGERRRIPENNRILYDRMALIVACIPLTFIFWFFSFVTAPVALTLCFYGWRRPGSLVPRWSRARFIIAGVLAFAQIAGWIIFFGRLIFR
ncbi:MAG TPA: hypothetical protein VHD32_13825 [Candidatus Didemnitutus sp.]|nr:hypothetical protein [Candidatus Didemnitutus sp.]